MFKNSNHADGRYPKECIEEAIQLALDITEGAKELGYDPNNRTHLKNMCDGKRPDGSLLSPSLKSGKHQNVQSTHSVSPSLSNWAKTVPWDQVVKVAKEVLMPILKEEEQMFQGWIKARAGAAGLTKKDCNLIGIHMVHATSREGELLLHTQSFYFSRVIRLEDKKIVTGDFRPLFQDMQRMNRLFQIQTCIGMETKMSVSMNFCQKSDQAIVEGISNTFNRTARNDKAREHLAKIGVPETKKSMAIARQITRPKKLTKIQLEEQHKQWASCAEDLGEAKKIEPSQSIWKQIFEDFIKLPAKVIAQAYVISRLKKRDKVRVHDVAALIKDASKPTRASRHKAALRAVRREQHESFWNALTCAEKAFKKAGKPKLVLPKKTKVLVHRRDIKSEEQEDQLNRLAKKHGWSMKVIGPKVEEKQEQSRGQSL